LKLDGMYILMSYGHAALVALLYLVLFWTIAVVLFLRRDAN
jgi:hypothetical protein